VRAKSGLYSTANLNPIQLSRNPNNIKLKPSASAPRNTVRAVIEIDLTWPVGPESHMSCMIILTAGGGF
jgi:hypothetical protein